MGLRSFRWNNLTRPIFRWAGTAMPPVSETEREAIDAGTDWWDGELLSGTPDWNALLAMPPAKLRAREMNGPVRELYHWRQLSRLSAAFALLSDLALLTPGGRARAQSEARIRDPEQAHHGGLISDDELARTWAAEAATSRVIAVDAFPIEDISPLASQHRHGKTGELREAAK